MTTSPFYLVWNEDGGVPRVKHPTQHSAENEAERLAQQYPGQRFVVLEPVSRFSVRRVNVERFQSTAEVPF